MSSAEKYAQADALQAQVDTLRKEAREERMTEGRAKPLEDRLVYAAYNRCSCGAGLAYDPFHDDEYSPFRGPDAWHCSTVLLSKAEAGQHAVYPFSMYEIKSENQPSAQGATTRPTPK